MPPPSTSALTADNLKSSQSARLHSSASKYYDSSRIYYAPYGSHNNSEYASQSSDTCTSDALSFTTDTTDTLDDPRSRKRREKVEYSKNNFFFTFYFRKLVVYISTEIQMSVLVNSQLIVVMHMTVLFKKL